jgi:hypothetical protein
MRKEGTRTRARSGLDSTYPWPRFWVPRDGTIDLSDAGFLRDPTDWPAGPRGPAPLAALQDWRALVLLGEPGIGKSTALREEADRVASLPADANLVYLYVDLRAFSSESLLYQRVFESDKFVAWKNGNSHLFLHLDSLDEALLRIDSIANLLAAELPGTPTERMSLRIACRTAVWPADTLGSALTSIWGEASGTFELAPLRRRDLFTTLEAHDIAVEGFMRTLFAAQAVPFAIKPLTLKMLLTIYQKRGNLPHSSIDLYKQGCLALCEERNKSRRDTGRRGNLNAGQRMRLAGRIAAATILGNRFAVWTGPEIDRPSDDISVSALAGHREEGEFATFNATDDDVREVLDSGLFSSRGESRMGWAHQAYGEFLAALYLFERGVPAKTTLKALLHPAGGLIPQLSGVAAWAASLSGELRAALIAEEPLTLLRGDLSGWSADDRKSLVKSLLDSIELKRVTDSPFSNAEAYAKLNHPGLVAELRPIITNRQLGATTRSFALVIVEKCRLTELKPELLQVALNTTDDPIVRAGAVSALTYCGDASVPPLIRPLAAGNGGADPNDEIKGNALELLWPDYITAAELFPLLTPSVDNYFGAYAFFQMALPNTLKTVDLLPALEWATRLIAQSGLTGGFHGKRLADAIMFKAWQVFERRELTRPFLEHIAVRLHKHGGLCRGTDHDAQKAFISGLHNDANRRRMFLRALCTGALDRFEAYSYRRVGLLDETDLEWLLSIAPGGSEPAPDLNLDTLYNLIECAFVVENVTHFEALYAAAERWPALRARYASWFDGIRLDSPEVAQFRTQQEQLRALKNDRPPPLVTDLSNQILTRLAEAEAGRWQAWWQLTYYLMLTPESRGFGNELDYFITAMPGWDVADEMLRARIVAGAELYLAAAETSIDAWLGHQPMPVYRNDVAGVRAFILLRQVSPEGYDRIADGTWRRWAPVIVGLPRATGIDKSPEIAQVLTDALRHASGEFVAAVRTIIRLERERIRAPGATPTPGTPFFILNDLDGCWHSAVLKDAIYDELGRADNTPAEYAALLDTLLEAGVEPALDHALGLLAESGPSTRARSIAIADVLLRRAAVRSWPALRAAITSDDDFAREVLLHVASHFSFKTPFYTEMNERDLADLYVLTARLFPRNDDSEQATGFIETWESIGYVRDGIPRYLAELGTNAAIVALSDLIAGHPELSNLTYELSLAERTMRIATWSPLSPKEVLALADQPNLQLVTSPADLCQVLVGALEKFNAALHGAQTPVRDLWDRQRGKDIFRPIDENALSDVIVRFLRAELGSAGIFANREVEISRAPGAPVGQRTDVLVNAVRRQPDGEQFDPIAAVIETKGCWNSELFTALEEQLFRDYMIRLRAQAGIYLVGWFDTEKWDPEDSRRGRVPKITMVEAKQRLDRQAAALPEGFVVRPVVLECHVPKTSAQTG